MTRLTFMVLVGALALAVAPVASAQTTSAPEIFEHDDSLDGDPNTEIVGGFFGLVPGSGSPDAQRRAVHNFLEANDDDDDYSIPNPSRNFAWETYEFAVKNKDVGDPDDPEDDVAIENGSFTVSVRWGNPDVDFDLYVYRVNPDDSQGPDPIAQSAAGATTDENATYFAPYSPADPQPPVESDCEPTPETDDLDTTQCRYVAYVDNWCSHDDDPMDTELREDFGLDICDQEGYEDEDDWTGEVSFAPLVRSNVPPTADLQGPTSGSTGENLTFTGSGTDADGTIERYAFDLDGDGRFEYDNGKNPSVSKRYDTAGTYSVGLRVTDSRGGVAYDSQAVTITGPATAAPTPGAAKPTPARLIASFKLGRPVFGGRRNGKLVARYRIRRDARVTLSLYRGSRRVKRIVGNRRANRSYRVLFSSKGRRRGNYTVRMTAVTPSGERQTARLFAKRI